MNKKPLAAVLGGVSALAITASAVLQILSLLLSYESEIHFYRVGAVLPTVAAICAVVGAVAGIVCASIIPVKRETAYPLSGSVIPMIPAALASLVTAFVMLTADGILAKLTSVFLFLSVAYFVLTAYKVIRVSGNLLAFLGFCPPAACALFNAYYYFDTSIEMNAPVKVLLQAALLFSMLYFTGEIRFLFDRQRPRFYLMLAACMLASTALTLSIPIAFAAGLVTRLDYLVGALFLCGITATAVCRVVHMLRHPLPPPVTEVTDTPDEKGENA